MSKRYELTHKYTVKVIEVVAIYEVEAESVKMAEELTIILARNDGFDRVSINASIDLSDANDVDDCKLITDEDTDETKVYCQDGIFLEVYDTYNDAVQAVKEGTGK